MVYTEIASGLERSDRKLKTKGEPDYAASPLHQEHEYAGAASMAERFGAERQK